ncbi:hypothetical protein ACVW02_003952 [Ewingella americana]
MAEELKNQVLHARVAHGFDQYQRATHVIVVIGQRLGDGFPHGFPASKVNHRMHGVLAENLIEDGAIADIALIEQRRFATQRVDPLEDAGFAVVQVI